jgi:hypothetical protein
MHYSLSVQCMHIAGSSLSRREDMGYVLQNIYPSVLELNVNLSEKGFMSLWVTL